MKIPKYTFCRKFNLDLYWSFYHDNVIIVTSFELRSRWVNAVFCPAVFFYNSWSVKEHCELPEKWTSSTSKIV